MASRAVIGGIVDERAVVTKKEEDEENARVGGEGIDPGLVDELYESLRDAVRGSINQSNQSIVGRTDRVAFCVSCRVSNDGDGSLY